MRVVIAWWKKIPWFFREESEPSPTDPITLIVNQARQKDTGLELGNNAEQDEAGTTVLQLDQILVVDQFNQSLLFGWVNSTATNCAVREVDLHFWMSKDRFPLQMVLCSAVKITFPVTPKEIPNSQSAIQNLRRRLSRALSPRSNLKTTTSLNSHTLRKEPPCRLWPSGYQRQLRVLTLNNLSFQEMKRSFTRSIAKTSFLVKVQTPTSKT